MKLRIASMAGGVDQGGTDSAEISSLEKKIPGDSSVAPAEETWQEDGQERFEQELKRAREAAEAAKREKARAVSLLGLVLGVTPTGFAVLDKQFRYVQVNEAMARLDGLGAEAHFGRRIDEVLGEELALGMLPMLQDVLTTGQAVTSQEIEVEREDKGGSEWWLADYYPVSLPGEELVGIGMMVQDITERKRAEKELARQKLAAEAASRAKDQFLAVLSHELRTPLSPVLATVAAMAEDSSLSVEVRETMEMVRRNVELEARLIDDLLDITRITNGKLQLNPVQINIVAAIQNILDICLSEIQGKELSVRLELEVKNCYVKADPARLQQALWNLLKNAVKFTPARGEIVVRCEYAGVDRVRVQIKDTGIGIDPAALPRVFNAFEQVEPGVTHKFGGLGLGLAIAKAMVEVHGGSLIAFSDGKDRGAIFTMELPTVKAKSNQTEQGSEEPANKPGQAKAKILLVEDHADTLRAMKRLLEKSGHQVHTAVNVTAAKEMFKQEEVDLLISDIGLPDGNGLDLMRDLKGIRSVKGIALSGFGMEEDIRKSSEAGYLAHLTKPVNLQRLEAVIRQLLEGGIEKETDQ